MACDATARLYDVDEDAVLFNRLRKTQKYDQATITFRARKGKLIDLEKLHESIWATRLSGGTRSGLVRLEVTAIGHVVASGDEPVLVVRDSDAKFVLAQHPDDDKSSSLFDQLQTATDEKIVKLTGVLDGYQGRWPNLLRTKPKKPRRILVTGFEVLEAQ